MSASLEGPSRSKVPESSICAWQRPASFGMHRDTESLPPPLLGISGALSFFDREKLSLRDVATSPVLLACVAFPVVVLCSPTTPSRSLGSRQESEVCSPVPKSAAELLSRVTEGMAWPRRTKRDSRIQKLPWLLGRE